MIFSGMSAAVSVDYGRHMGFMYGKVPFMDYDVLMSRHMTPPEITAYVISGGVICDGRSLIRGAGHVSGRSLSVRSAYSHSAGYSAGGDDIYARAEIIPHVLRSIVDDSHLGSGSGVYCHTGSLCAVHHDASLACRDTD